MNKVRSRKRKWAVRSVTAGLLCTAMMIGSTWAWFSDSASTGTNKVVAGNLKIGLQYKNGKNEDGSDKWDDATLPDVKLFDDVKLWEPGVVTYEEFKISNLGSLAAKFTLFSDNSMMKTYCIAEPNTDEDTKDDNSYVVTERTLADMLYVASFAGSFKDLVEAVNAKMPDGEQYNTGDLNDEKNREVLYKAIEEDIIPYSFDLYDDEGNFTVPDGAIGTFEQLCSKNLTDDNNGFYDGALLPDSAKGPEEDGSWTYSYRKGDNQSVLTQTIKNPSDTQEVTVILFWLPDSMKATYVSDYDFETSGRDNQYNLANGKKGTNIPLFACDEGPDLGDREFEELLDEEESFVGYLLPNENLEDYLTDDGLKINLSIGVFATQVEYESDSFGNKYDEYVWPSNEVPGPGIGED